MKTKTLQYVATTLLPAVLLGLAGCGTAPVNPLAIEQSPTLAGGTTVIETFSEKADVTSLVSSRRTLPLRSEAGNTITCKAAPQVANFDQIQVGARVEATITELTALFLAKNGPPPSAGPGVEVESQTAGVVLQTTDSRAKATKVDRSYRLLTVEYANGSTKEFKVPLPHTLKNVQPGDEVVVRSTEPLAIRLEPE
jgi:hypothetical protein